MDWEKIFYITSYVVGIVVSLGVTRYAWQRRSIPGAEFFALFNLCAVQWSLSSILALVSTNSDLQEFWDLVGMIGVWLNPVMWLAFAIKYTGRGKWLTPRTWMLILFEPVIALLLLESAGIYLLVQTAREVDLSEAIPWAGMVVLLTQTYVTLLLIVGTLLVVQKFVRAPQVYRGRYLTLLVGLWAPWTFGVLAFLEQNLFPVELLPIGFAIGGVVAAWGIFRYQVFDIMPIALDTVIASISDGVIVLDTQHRIVDMNPAAQSMTHLSTQQIVGQPIAQVLSHWKDLLCCLDQGQTHKVISLKEPVASQVKGERAESYYEFHISPLHDRRETLLGQIILLHDITARVRGEKELRQVNDEIVLRNRDLTLLNRVITATTSKLEPQAVLETVCQELALAFDLPHAAVAMLNDARTALTVVAESGSEERPSGVGAVIPVENNPATQYVLEHKTPLAIVDAQHDPRMAPVHELMRQYGIASLLILPLTVRDKVVGTIGLDAFERREFSDAEITLAANSTAAAARALEQARAEEALRESEDTLKLAVEAANVGLWHLNITPDETVFIRAWTPGQSDEPIEMESTVKAWAQMEQVHPDDRAKWLEAWGTYLSGDTPLFEVEHRVRTESGEWTWNLQRGQVVARDEHGQPVRIAGMNQDISARVRAQEELREAQAAAEEARLAAEAANRAKSEFLANMSHELRTPLNAILGFAQLMARDSGLTAEQRENLETIGRSGEHLLGLINDVLDLSKIEAGRVALHEESFDLHRLLDGLEEMFHLRAVEKGLMLIFDRAPDVPQYVHTDEGKLRQVLMNLLGNAVKFTQEGGVTLRMGYNEGKDDPASLLVEVEDTGAGIAPEELDAVFDPFKQTASGQISQEGTGLGMPISRQFVRLMGGNLTVHSELGVGTLFRFDVQIELADAADVPTSQPKRKVVGLEPDQPVYRLLVVEDREANRKLLVKLLAPLGGDAIQELDNTGPPLGLRMFKDMTWEQRTAQLAPGDVLVLYSDGVTEAEDDQEELFDEERLLQVGQANLGRSAQEVQDTILAEVDRFVGDASQVDDITLMVLARLTP